MKLNDLRKEIEMIDDQLRALFVQRLSVSKQIGIYKKEHQLPILDAAREKELMEAYRLKLNDETLWPFYQQFIQTVFTISKEAQK